MNFEMVKIMPKLFKRVAQTMLRPIKNVMDNTEQREEEMRELALFAKRVIFNSPYPRLEPPKYSLPRRAVKKLLNAVYQ